MEQRRNDILEILDEKGSVSIKDLSRQFGCSEVTIRTDIRALEGRGKLLRTHGGAKKLPVIDTLQAQPDPTFSIFRLVEEKKNIASRAYQYINNHDIIILDDSSTSYHLGMYIKAHPEKQLTIVTNSLLIANELFNVVHTDVYMIGGHVGGRLPATLGELASGALSGMKVNKAFIGVHGINFDVGITSVATPQMQVKQAILRVSSEVYVLADSTKFDASFLSVICPLDRIRMIISDSHVTDEIIAKAAEKGVTLVVAK